MVRSKKGEDDYFNSAFVFSWNKSGKRTEETVFGKIVFIYHKGYSLLAFQFSKVF